MLPLLGGLITGGAGLLSSFMNSTTSAQNTQAQIAAQQGMLNQTEGFNAEQAQVQRDYETQMSNTAYQRASKDMQAAGLNPAMMFSSGGAASTPSVSAPSVGTPSVPMSQRTSPWSGVGDAVGKAVSTAVQAKTFDKMTQEIANLQTQQALTAASTRTEEAKPPLVHAETEATSQRAAQTAVATRGAIESMPARTLEGTTAQDVLNMPAWLRSGLVQAGFAGDKASRAIEPVADVFNTLTSSALKRRGLDLLKQRHDLSASQFEETYGYHPSDRE